MKSEQVFLTEILQHIADAEMQAQMAAGCAVQGSLYLKALRGIEGSARMRLNVLESRHGSERTSAAPTVDTGGSKGTP